MKHVMVIDLETTGLRGIKEGDKILSVGIADVELDTAQVRPVFYTPIRQELDEHDRRCWLILNGHLTAEEIERAPFSETQAATITATILADQLVTSYNTEFDFDTFLYPWLRRYLGPYFDLDYGMRRAPCIMQTADRIKEIPRRERLDGTAYPSLVASFSTLVHLPMKRAHNALDDALMAGEVLVRLHKMGLFTQEAE